MPSTTDKKSDILIILDLDETLIHATEKKLNKKEDFKIFNYFVYNRPHLVFFLQELSKHFKMGIWSSGSDDYVQKIINKITPKDIQFEIVWGRSRCSIKRDFESQDYCYEKRLDKLKRKGFKLEKILLIDDSPEKAKKNYGNAIYIKEFIDDNRDNELLKLLKYLISLKNVENIRIIEKRGWRNKVDGI